ncbi:class I glutamine amidotransferase-like protein [Pterulicium gracile]|uniref:D-lactate dehydratase n=1 Tax=Pterulicium gracile TaxID=1884261 RepID=A0A5C3QWN7_9AGAR|nr:class I glutamine amidotransferase-like protein [Pterula gracilis]
MTQKKVLFIFTSCDKTLKGGQTGWYLPEAAHPYNVLSPHYDLTFASPKGSNPPVDEGSVKMFQDDAGFLSDPVVIEKLKNAKKLSEVKAADYDAIFYVGGHGPVIDLPVDADNAKLASEFYQAGKITAAVCHGPAALVQAVDASGKSIFAGKRFTGFSNVEEEQVKMVDAIPFSLEDKISGLGGKYEKAAEPWGVHVVVDGHLVTGQNPASAKSIAEKIAELLK